MTFLDFDFHIIQNIKPKSVTGNYDYSWDDKTVEVGFEYPCEYNRCLNGFEWAILDATHENGLFFLSGRFTHAETLMHEP